MRRWTLRLVWAMACGVAMPALAQAQTDLDHAINTMVNAGMKKGAPPPAADPCPYRAATSYNAIVVHRPVPSSANNMPNYTLCCEIPKQNLDTYVAPPCEWGNLFHRCNDGCGGGCDNGCGSIFGSFNFNRGCGGNANSCNSGCGTSKCNTGCGTTTCNTGCGNTCDRGYRGWQRFSCGSSNCGCNTGCGGTTPAPAATPAAPAAPRAVPANKVSPVSNIEQIGFWTRNKCESPVNDCLSCPPGGPKQKYSVPTASALGCTGCSTWESEGVFIFGTCRQFFGEPTHRWLNGK